MGKMYVLEEEEKVVYLVKATSYDVDFYGKIEKNQWFNEQVETLEKGLKIVYDSLTKIEKWQKSMTFRSHQTFTISKLTMSLNAIDVECIATLGFQPTRKNLNKLIKDVMLSRIPTID